MSATTKPIIGLLRRWSTPGQDASFRREVQLDVLIDQCRRNGWDWKVYDEGQVSGQRLEKRKTAQALLSDLKAGRIQGLGALDLKRVTRDRIGIDRAVIKGIIIEAKAILVTRDKVYDLRKPDDAMMYDVVGALAGHEIVTIRNTFWDGNVARRVSGSPSNCAAAPVGYRHVQDGPIRPDGRVPRRMEKHPDEADVVETFWQIAATAPSYAFITKELNRRGIPYPRVRRRSAENEGGTLWQLNNVQPMVRNWAYSGLLVLGRTGRGDVWELHPETRGASNTEHGGIYDRHVPEWAYVSEDLQRSVLERLDGNADPAAGNGATRGLDTENPLRGILRCNRCGGPMYHQVIPRKRADGTVVRDRYQRCAHYLLQHGTCPGQSINQDRAVEAVLTFLQGMLAEPFHTQAGQIAASLEQDPEDSLATARGQLRVLEEKHRKVLERELLSESEEETAALATIRRQTEQDLRRQKRDIAALEEASRSADLVGHYRDVGEHFTEYVLAMPWYVQRQVIGSFLTEVRVVSEGRGTGAKRRVTAYRTVWMDQGSDSETLGSSVATTLIIAVGDVVRLLAAG